MLINALHPEEARVAIVDENGQLVDLDIEITGSEQQRGNIYKGVVLRVEPALQAAFIDIGLKKPGFLQLGELHPDNWQWRDDLPEDQRKKRPRIQEVLRRGQELLVQVEKDEREMKGAAVTSYISIPGRYMVIMPGSDSSGISRKVEGEGERKKLKDMVKEMTIPEGVGYIIRTEAVGRTLEELQKDLDSLIANYNEIVEKGKQIKGPDIIYKEYAVVIRTIRDYFSADIDEVLVDSKEVYKEAKAFFKETMPALEKRVKMHQEKRPIFSRYQIEEQIDQIYEKKVPLKSGGSLVIEPTEALVSIDVNSGKSTGERGVEDTAFRTNLEAVEEAARQLRLRDLGGLIVLDLIDMRELKHVKEVEKALKSALKSDKARVTVGRISQFGMLEMSRQRIKQTLEQGSVLDCPHCSGRGKVKGVENMAISFLRKVHAAAAKGNAAEVHGALPLEVAYYLLNRKKRELAQIENDYDIEVTIKGKPSFLMNQLELELIKREKVTETHQPDEKSAKGKPVFIETTSPSEPDSEVKVDDLVVAPPEETSARKKKSRSKKKKLEPEPVELLLAEPDEPEESHPSIPSEPLPEEPAAEEQADAGKKKRKRRRRKKAKPADALVLPDGEASASEEIATEEVPHEDELTSADAEVSVTKKKKRRRRKRGSTKPPAEAMSQEIIASQPEAGIVDADSASVLPEEPSSSKKRSRERKKPAVIGTALADTPDVTIEMESHAPSEEKPARRRGRPAVKKDSNSAEPVVEAPPEVFQVEPELPAEKPKPKRVSRKKKGKDEEG